MLHIQNTGGRRPENDCEGDWRHGIDLVGEGVLWSDLKGG